MEQHYTVNNLIKLIYGECDLFDRLEIEDAIKNDQNLKLEYLNLRNSFRALPRVTFSPSKKSIQFIIDFAENQLGATA